MSRLIIQHRQGEVLLALECICHDGGHSVVMPTVKARGFAERMLDAADDSEGQEWSPEVVTEVADDDPTLSALADYLASLPRQ